jgi:hypothetical protein
MLGHWGPDKVGKQVHTHTLCLSTYVQHAQLTPTENVPRGRQTDGRQKAHTGTLNICPPCTRVQITYAPMHTRSHRHMPPLSCPAQSWLFPGAREKKTGYSQNIKQ